MIKVGPNSYIVETVADLPDFENAKRLYLDGETTSFDPYEAATLPYAGHRFAGVAVTADNHPDAYYIPVRHAYKDGTRMPSQIPVEIFQRWLRRHVTSCETWVNHNVAFDASFAHVDNATFDCVLKCTLTLSKLIDSDRMFKGGYGLKALSEAWLGEVITDKQDAVKDYLDSLKFPRNKKAKDYGLVPVDLMGTYACQDVLTNRRLDLNLDRRKPDDMNDAWETEIKLTSVLFDIQCEGMRVHPDELDVAEYQALTYMMGLEEELHEELGFTINPGTNAGCYEALVNHYGLPVLEYNDSGNPSFDKEALKQYVVHPLVVNNEARASVVNKILAYRKRSTLLGTFIRAYKEQHVNGVLHPSYNQAVRSGRLSCRKPNAQQLSKAAKRLIHPKPGEAFLCCDYRQIEFRLIVHYIRDIEAIQAYERDPETDFHTWVAEMCGIPRDPAKNVNFAIGYGAGKRKVMTMLASNMELMASLGAQVDEMIALGQIHSSERKSMFDALCMKRAEEVYWTYHDTLPGLRLTTKQAARKIEARGYVRNAYGRRAHLDPKHAHIAFNRLIQGCAADLMKERTVAVSPRYNQAVRDLGVRLCWSVHDETGFTGDKEVMRDPHTVKTLAHILEDTSFKFRVPIRTSAEYSDKSWADTEKVEIPRD